MIRFFKEGCRDMVLQGFAREATATSDDVGTDDAIVIAGDSTMEAGITGGVAEPISRAPEYSGPQCWRFLPLGRGIVPKEFPRTLGAGF